MQPAPDIANMSLIEGLAADVAVLQPQFVQEVLEMWGQTSGVGSQILPQPVSDSLADRRAGGAIDVLVSVSIRVGHCSSRFGFMSTRSHQMITPNQVLQLRIVSDFVGQMAFR
jgi:hypothetical protein